MWLVAKMGRKKRRKKRKKENNNNKILLYFVGNMLCGVKVLKSSSTYIKVSNNANENFTVKKLKILSNAPLFIIIHIIINTIEIKTTKL